MGKYGLQAGNSWMYQKMSIVGLSERAEKAEQLQADLKRLNRMLQAAHRSSIDIKESYDFYILALKEFNKENIEESDIYYNRATYELTSAINAAKIKIKGAIFHSPRTLSYFVNLYGLYAVLFASFAIFFFSFLIYPTFRTLGFRVSIFTAIDFCY